MSTTLEEALRFFDVSRPVPNLRVMSFSHCLNGDQGQYKFSMAADKNTWRELDRALARGHFTGLQKVHINVDLRSSTPEGMPTEGWNDSATRDEIIRANFLDLFCESRRLSIPFEVDVTVDRKFAS